MSDFEGVVLLGLVVVFLSFGFSFCGFFVIFCFVPDEVDVLELVVFFDFIVFEVEKLDQDIIGKKVVFSNQEYPKEFFGDRSNSCLRLIDKCLEKNPEKRISINEFLKDEWVCRESQ